MGVDPKQPAKKRNTIRESREGAKAHATVKMTKPTFEILYSQYLPYISDKGAKIKGPIAKPRT
jgi:hypothetical protein